MHTCLRGQASGHSSPGHEGHAQRLGALLRQPLDAWRMPTQLADQESGHLLACACLLAPELQRVQACRMHMAEGEPGSALPQCWSSPHVHVRLTACPNLEMHARQSRGDQWALHTLHTLQTRLKAASKPHLEQRPERTCDLLTRGLRHCCSAEQLACAAQLLRG